MSARSPQPPSESPETPASSPEQYPVPPPPNLHTDDRGWLLPTLMEMQRSIGELSQAVRTLTEQSRDDRKKLDKISHQVYAAVLIVGVIVSVASFVAARWLADTLSR